jgi:hypothetical protein
MVDTMQRFLCIASYEKGQDFLRQCAEMGVRPTLLTVDELRDRAWPREALEDLATVPAELSREQILNTVCWMVRGRRFDRIVALDEFDLEIAAQIREHMRIPGMNISTAACYRDKLAMRTSARRSGFLVPEFCGVFNYDDLRAYMARVPAPWLLKPRAEASALGIRKIQEPEQLWRSLDELGDRQSYFLLEQFVPGEIFHVDSIVSEGRVVFSAVHQYGRPPMQVMHEGGVFTTRTVDRGGNDWKQLTELNARLAPSLGMERGVTHAEYIRAHADGRFYFLEIVAGVGETGGGQPARRDVSAAATPGELRRQRALPGQDRRAGHQRIRGSGNCGAHAEAPPRRADCAVREGRAGEGAAGAIQRGICGALSGVDAASGQTDVIEPRQRIFSMN